MDALREMVANIIGVAPESIENSGLMIGLIGVVVLVVFPVYTVLNELIGFDEKHKQKKKLPG